MIMDVLLIKPTKNILFGKFYTRPLFPIGLGYIGAVLEKNGFDVGILDLDLYRNIYPNEEEKYLAIKPSYLQVNLKTFFASFFRHSNDKSPCFFNSFITRE